MVSRTAASVRGWSLNFPSIDCAARSSNLRTVTFGFRSVRAAPNPWLAMSACPSKSFCKKPFTARAMFASSSARRFWVAVSASRSSSALARSRVPKSGLSRPMTRRSNFFRSMTSSAGRTLPANRVAAAFGSSTSAHTAR